MTGRPSAGAGLPLSSHMTDQLVSLPWDSEFLGFPVGTVTSSPGGEALPALVARARAQGYRLLYLVVPPDDPAGQATARAQGGLLVDRKVTYLRVVPSQPEPVEDADIVAVTAYTPALRSLTLQSGIYSRFRLDPNVAPGVFENLYTTWMQKSLSGQLARTVLAYPSAGPELGMLTLGEQQGRADIGLMAVAAAARRGHIGQRLVAVACGLTVSWGLRELQVVTQLENEGACRFYEKCGFHQEKVNYIYHLWLR